MKTKLFLLILFFSITTYGQTIYVNQTATGNNDGTSWGNAFTDLQNAIAISNSTSPIWVASGVYTPHATDRNVSFVILNKQTSMYGGFNGTETLLSERNPLVNVTVLSGDLLGDDNATLLETEPTRQDNSYHVISIKGSSQGVIVDGFTISGGNANGTVSSACSTPAVNQVDNIRGAAIYVSPYVINTTASVLFSNCILEKNTAISVAVYSRFYPCGITNLTADVDFESSIIRDNYSRDFTAMLFGGAAQFGLINRGSIVNCVFYNNTSLNNSSCIYLGTSTGGGVNGVDVDIINTTFAGNTGLNGNVITISRAENTTIKSTIIFGNGSTTPITTTYGVPVVTNSIIEGGQLGGINTDPLFVNLATNDFSLQIGSPALDTGDNSLVSSIIKDVVGADRIIDNIVDLGAYEGCSTCTYYGLTTTIVGSGSITTPISSLFTPGTSISVTAVPDTGYGFDNWSGDLTSTNVTESITMNSDKSITANFSTLTQYTLTVNITGSGTVVLSPPGGTYFDGDIITLTATAGTDGFVGWSGDLSSINNPAQITIDGNKTVTAVFGASFVKHDATGANNGTSWTDALTNLEDALSTATSSSKVWVARGIYIPTTTNTDPRDATFLMPNGVEIYGGFNGTETLLSERNPTTNITVLSGDLSANDNAILLETEPTRQDNAYHVVSVRGNSQNVIVDGFTISGGNANGALNNACATPAIDQSYNTRGAAIYANPYVSGNTVSALFSNCILEKNTATSVAAYSPFTPCGVQNLITDVDFESCIVRDNYSRDLAPILFVGAQQFTLFGRGSIVNSLFHNNTSLNGASCVYLATSGGGSITGIDVDIINTTFTGNTGANGYVIAMDKAQNTRIRNSIIFGNGSNTPISSVNGSSATSNNIFEGGQLGGLNSNPLFVNASINDFTLTSDSPALDTGNNTYIPTGITQDLQDDARITYGTVDMGAYELSTACVTPINIQLTNIGDFTVDVLWTSTHPSTTNWDVTYVETGQPISSGTTLSNVGISPYTITGLIANTTYDVYVRSDCGGGLKSNWSSVISFTTKGPIFVNLSATGNNDGTSWENAFTDLQDALSLATVQDPIWVASGVYTPHATDRKGTFSINSNTSLLGGFNGTETDVTQRDISANVTVLSGDLQVNDSATLQHNESTRQDNSFHVVTIRGNMINISISGFTISGGNANGSALGTGSISLQYDDTRGAAIFSQTLAPTSYLATSFFNCILENNTAINSSAYGHMPSGASWNGNYAAEAYVNFFSCTIRNNYSQNSSTILYIGSGFYKYYNRGVIKNSLFYNNVSDNSASCVTSFSSSTDPYNNANTVGSSRVDMANNTFANNTGSGDLVITIFNGDNLATFLRNSIIYGNGTGNPISSSGYSGGITIQNTITTDPLFTNSSINDYTLQTGSTAIDTGNNSYVVTALDLNGNPRIFNTTVDMGAFEFDPSTLGLEDNTIINDFTIYPNPTSSILNIKMNTTFEKAEIYNILGAKVLESKEQSIDVSNLKSGVYLIKVANERGNFTTKRFIKQ